MFHFAENDLPGIVDLEDELASLLTKKYNFYVEQFEIPPNPNHKTLRQKIEAFSDKWSKKDSLLIYIYSGHGVAIQGQGYDLA